MIFYDIRVKYRKLLNDEIATQETGENWEQEEEKPKKTKRDFIRSLNSNLGEECGLDGNVSAFVHQETNGILGILVGIKPEKVNTEDYQKFLKDHFKEECSLEMEEFIKAKEVTAKDVVSLNKKINNQHLDSFSGWFPGGVGIEYFENRNFKVTEKCINDDFPKSKAVKQTKKIMADSSLEEEIGRIYSEKNVKKFYGHPVHYSVQVSAADAADDIVDLIVKALAENKRIEGHRVIKLSQIKSYCYDESDLTDLFKSAIGNVVVIEMSGSDGFDGNYASEYVQVAEEFAEKIKKDHLNTLFILVESLENPGFSNILLPKISHEIDLIEIKDGAGDFTEAKTYFRGMIEDSSLDATDEEIKKYLPKKKVFTSSEVCKAYKNWFADSLKEKFYTEYKKCKTLKVEAKKKTKSYEQLQEMIGLVEIKEITDQIIDTGRMNKIRAKSGFNAERTSMHMIFTGNPGSAKTSVARLIADILKEEGVVDTGEYVEVGRSDLVARYVGWTAKTVKEKFRAAKGGVLFIDEAYSLVDGSNSFGDEAINTIVQEMENHRDDVIVIFAGYPDKMEEFLKKNEGLRSRIAFHLNFPDYTADEMVQIFELMAKNKGYKVNEEVLDKCHGIFEAACKQAEFGNGRFARNLIEQAQMKQSKRIMTKYHGKKVPKDKLTELLPEDFDVNVSRKYEAKTKTFGFVAS